MSARHHHRSGPVIAGEQSLGDSYRLLADIYHQFLLEHSLEALLDAIADALADLIPHDTLTIYEADENKRRLTAVLSRDAYSKEIMEAPMQFGEGITGWAVVNREPVLANDAHLDSRVSFVPGTPVEPESMIVVPLVARGAVKGTLNLYREGGLHFTDNEFELARRFGDAAALAIDNAHVRAALEHQAQTDPLTGLYNHRFFHERLRAEISRAIRAHDSIALLMFDIDDFKKLNDVYGHGVGDHVLVGLAEVLNSTIRTSDVACRIGGEEFAVILPSCDSGDALGLARRLRDRLAVIDFDPAGSITISVGVAQSPENAMNPRELIACAETAMMTAKARGKNRSVLFSEEDHERPGESSTRSDVRSIAHLKMLQSLAGKLNRLNDVRQIAETIASELRTLIDYHSCRIFLADGEDLIPIAVRGHFEVRSNEYLVTKVGEGVTGRAAAMARSVFVPNALECDFSVLVPGTDEVEETLVAVPMMYGAKVNGVITISKLGAKQLDEDDVRLMEVLSGQASVALENARLYEAKRREAENARALLSLADRLRYSVNEHEICNLAVDEIAGMLNVEQATMWLYNRTDDAYRCAAHHGYAGHPEIHPLVTRRVGQQEADMLLEMGPHPFVLTPEEMHERFPELPRSADHPVAIAPLGRGEDHAGWLVARQPTPQGPFFTEEKLRLMEGVAHQVAVAMQKAVLYRDQKETAEIASALLELSRQLSSAESMDEVLQKVVERSANILGCPRASIWLQEIETGDLVPEAFFGFPEDELEERSADRYPGDVIEPVLSQITEPFVIRHEDYSDDVQTIYSEPGMIHAIAPLKLDGRVGCLAVLAPAMGDYQFSERKMRLLAGIADQAKLALNNANNFEILESTFLSTIEALANALEAKDEYTSDHTRSIVEMSLEVGEHLGLDTRELKRLEMAALFHDIGKIGIPSDILLKPAPLTDEERAVMNTHPELGERILAPIERLADVRPIVRACHEHFDGGGYPDGKAGDEIPLEARIILVVDAFDAMTTDRPYRKRLSAEEAIRRLSKGSGTQFDPKVIDAFMELFPHR